MAALIKSLRPYTTCDIGDALVKLKYPLGGFLDGISAWCPSNKGSIVGFAVTVKMVDAKDSCSPETPIHFADANEDGKIMYIQQPRDMYSACFGGIMALRAHRLGSAGIIVDGRFRDIEEIEELGLPMFARGVSILGSNTFSRASALNIPVQFKGNLWIHPGDILVGDRDGVVVVPPSLVTQVAQLCKERQEIDRKMVDALKLGITMGDVVKKFRRA